MPLPTNLRTFSNHLYTCHFTLTNNGTQNNNPKDNISPLRILSWGLQHHMLLMPSKMQLNIVYIKRATFEQTWPLVPTPNLNIQNSNNWIHIFHTKDTLVNLKWQERSPNRGNQNPRVERQTPHSHHMCKRWVHHTHIPNVEGDLSWFRTCRNVSKSETYTSERKPLQVIYEFHFKNSKDIHHDSTKRKANPRVPLLGFALALTWFSWCGGSLTSTNA